MSSHYLVTVKDAFCPDLLHSCPAHSTHSHSSSTSDVQPSPSERQPDEDYVEIDEIRQSVSTLTIDHNDPFHTNSTNFPHHFAKGNATCIAPIEEQAMGQSLSQRRPRISLTWVLRGEQQPANPSALLHHNVDSAENRAHEKKKFRSKSKDTGERLFSEKYVTEDEKIGDASLNNNRQRELLFVSGKNVGENASIDGYASDHCGGSSRNERCRRSDKTKVSSKFSMIKNNLNNFTHEKSDHFKDKSIVLSGENGFRDGSRNDVNGDFIKPTYSEPSLCTGQSRRHRHRRRRNRSQRFGYEIRNVDEFLSKVKRFFCNFVVQLLVSVPKFAHTSMSCLLM